MEDLTGTIVLVNPQLTVDPVQRQGEIGIITGTDLSKDEVSVGFGHSPLGLYSTDALLVLKPHNELYGEILSNVKEMETRDFKDLMKITMLQENGGIKQLREAMELAMTNEKVLAYSTVSLQDRLGIEIGHAQEANYKSGVSR